MPASTTHKTLTIEISPKTMWMLVAFAGGIWLLSSITHVLFVFFLAFILASALLVPIQKLQKKNVPKWLAVIIVYLASALITISVLSLITVPLTKETIRFLNNFPALVENLLQLLSALLSQFGLDGTSLNSGTIRDGLNIWTKEVVANFDNLLSVSAQGASGILSFLSGIFGGFFTFVLVVSASIYMIFGHDNLLNIVLGQFTGTATRKRIKKLIRDIEMNLGRWLVAQLIAAAVVGTLCWALLSILRVQYALPLAIFTGMLNPIPIIGAIASMIPGIIVVLAGGNIVQIILVPLAYIFVQQVESNIVTPRIMANAVGLPPLIVILALMIGAEISGLVGMVLAVPIAGILHITAKFLSEGTNKQPLTPTHSDA